MDFSSYCHVHILRPTSTEEIYLISTGTAPSTAVIVTNPFVTNNFMAFKAMITEEIIEDWHTDPMNAELTRPLFLEEIGKALVGASDSFTFEITYRFKVPQKVVLVNLMDTKNPKTILETKLEEIKASEGILALSRISLNSSKLSQLSTETKTEIQTLQKENAQLKKLLDEMTVSKARWEDCHYRAFTKILNTKKRRICELEGVQFDKKKASKRTQFNSSDESAELNTSDSGANSSDEYSRDTDLDNPGFGSRLSRIPTSETSHLPSRAAVPSKSKTRNDRLITNESETGSEGDLDFGLEEDDKEPVVSSPEKNVKSKTTPVKSNRRPPKAAGVVKPTKPTRGRPKKNRLVIDEDDDDVGDLEDNAEAVPSTSNQNVKSKPKPPPVNRRQPKAKAVVKESPDVKRSRVPVKKGTFVMDDTESDEEDAAETKSDSEKMQESEQVADGNDKLTIGRTRGTTKETNFKKLLCLDDDSATGSETEFKLEDTDEENATVSKTTTASPSVLSNECKVDSKKSPASSETGDEFDF